MIKIQIVEWATGKVEHEIEVRGASSIYARSVERTEMGLLRNMDMERYGTRAIDTESTDDGDQGEHP